ncbi:MAG: tRNA 4-thiouridine(8) synthase ThiI [Bacteriovorax sp.]|nr:tRNA 4-thiouridine(8) synthase ThiI [Bacteriovorax sp.]
MYNNFAISVDELWLKGRNRHLYLRAALGHISAILKNSHPAIFSQEILSQRIFYTSETPFSEELIQAILKVPGLASISPCRIIKRNSDQNFENIYEEILKEVSFFKTESKTFRATVRKNDKTISMTSPEIAKEIGHRILIAYPLARVDIRTPEVVVDVRILETVVSISSTTKKGIGGLPWGSTGSAVTMLSGGFDSPVASYMMMKRGIKQSFVFFYAYPFVGTEVLEKIKNLSSVLAKYQRQSHLYIVPFGNVQNLIAKNCKEEYRTMFFRRFMVEITNMLCDRIGADALITGDSVGQVSSQTVGNLFLIDQSSRRLIMRPLIGFNKQEIMNLGEVIGTYDISILPHDDACSLFASKNPIIKPNHDYWNNWNPDIDLMNELNKALDNAETYSINLKGELYKKDFLSFDS